MCFKLLTKPKGLPPPNNLIDIEAGTILTILKEKFTAANIYLSDSIYKTTNIDELIRFINSDKTNEYKYVSEYFDCDDFSFHLMGSIHNVEWGALPFGICWLSKPGGNHALNIFIDREQEVYFVEPQNDTVFLCPTHWVPYFVMI